MKNFNYIEDIEELRDGFKKIVDDLNNIIELNKSEKNDEEIEKELEIAGALYLMHLVELQAFLK
ncbi:hypothetical protein [Clostridium perfringens]|uniref:hypothetical protein n=1 Tax=Clostridium perfringens TaxID=1502 RepID=UPI0018E4A2F6|nr:hypothetical protein [Clostridium perfringens]MBI6052340.1 hypothetical protein [Clostridium perfringens]